MRRLAWARTVLRWTPWFVLLGAVATLGNLLLGNHITVSFWVASWALPGLALDLARSLNGGEPAWNRKEIFTLRGLVAVVIFLGVALPLESALDSVGGYHASSVPWYVNTDWSQLSDALTVTIAFSIARQFLAWTRPKAQSVVVVN